jgi:aminocarboxymuconate-semialdehyde decarboxylase
MHYRGRMTTIDIHAHFVDRHYLDDLKRVMRLDAEPTADGKTLLRERGATIAWTRPDMFEVENRLADMAQKNIDKRVLSVSAPNVYPWPATEQVEIASIHTIPKALLGTLLKENI